MDKNMRMLLEENGTSVSVLQSGYEGRGLLKIDFEEESRETILDSNVYHMLKESELNFLYQEEHKNGGWSRIFSFEERRV